MRGVSDLTYKVIAYSEIPNKNADECVDWAIEMIELGYDTPYLLMLAGFIKPANYFEVAEYLNHALAELGLKELSGEAAVISYSLYFIKKIASGSCNIKEDLVSLCEYCRGKQYDELFSDFHHLRWAWGDIDYGEKSQEYWPEANRENIESLVINAAEKWLQTNDEILKSISTTNVEKP